LRSRLISIVQIETKRNTGEKKGNRFLASIYLHYWSVRLTIIQAFTNRDFTLGPLLAEVYTKHDEARMKEILEATRLIAMGPADSLRATVLAPRKLMSGWFLEVLSSQQAMRTGYSRSCRLYYR